LLNTLIVGLSPLQRWILGTGSPPLSTDLKLPLKIKEKKIHEKKENPWKKAIN